MVNPETHKWLENLGFSKMDGIEWRRWGCLTKKNTIFRVWPHRKGGQAEIRTAAGNKLVARIERFDSLDELWRFFFDTEVHT